MLFAHATPVSDLLRSQTLPANALIVLLLSGAYFGASLLRATKSEGDSKLLRFIAAGWFLNFAYLLIEIVYGILYAIPPRLPNLSSEHLAPLLFVSTISSSCFLAGGVLYLIDLPPSARRYLTGLLSVFLFTLGICLFWGRGPVFFVAALLAVLANAASLVCYASAIRKMILQDLAELSNLSGTTINILVVWSIWMYMLLQFGYLANVMDQGDEQSKSVVNAICFSLASGGKFMHLVGLALYGLARGQRYQEFALKQRELEMRQEDLESKRAFIAEMAHELINPTASMTLYVDQLEKKRGPEITLNKLRNTLTRLEAIVYGTREWIEVIQQNDQPQHNSVVTISINDLVQAAIIETKSAARSICELKDIKPSFQTQYSRDLRVRASPSKLIQVFINVLRNSYEAFASSVSNKHGWQISVTTTKDDKEHVRVVIEDNAGGIPAELLPRLATAMSEVSSKGPGRGKGLGIVSRILSEHQGIFYIQSPLERTHGTRVTVTLPRASE